MGNNTKSAIYGPKMALSVLPKPSGSSYRCPRCKIIYLPRWRWTEAGWELVSASDDLDVHLLFCRG